MTIIRQRKYNILNYLKIYIYIFMLGHERPKSFFGGHVI